MAGRPVSRRRIEAALSTLSDLTTEEHDELDGRTRDDIAHVRSALHDILDGPAPVADPSGDTSNDKAGER